jgi:histone H3/H4
MTSFADISHTPRGHLGLLFYEAVHHVLCRLRIRALGAGRKLEDVFEEFPFLKDYFGELRARLPEGISWADSGAWIRREVEEWEKQAPEHLPLRALEHVYGLPPSSRLMFVLAGLVEEDASFGDLFAAMQRSQGHRRPTLGLLRELLPDTPGETAGPGELVHPLIRSSLLEAANRDAPRAEWVIAVPSAVWSAARGETALLGPLYDYHEAAHFPDLEWTIAPPETIRAASALRTAWISGTAEVAIFRGLAGSDRLALAGSVARSFDAGLLVLTRAETANDAALRQLAPAAALLGAVPVIAAELGPSDVLQLPDWGAYAGPSAVLLGREGAVAGHGAEQAITVDVLPEGPVERNVLWRQALPGEAGANASELAERFLLPAKYLQRAAQFAVTNARSQGREAVEPSDVTLAMRELGRHQLGSLATRLEVCDGWAGLVVAPSTENDLFTLERRCRHRETLSSNLAGRMPGGLDRGVRALFEGPSGTGKTLAVRALAAELSMDLYRVDLSATVNKYIGETEKNLARVLARAEDLNVVLLLDEGDALMTKRTDVRSSNDRYANLETNYLLQRLETYSGILIVTTNVNKNIDQAFRRRMDVVIHFGLPDSAERLRLWRLHLREARVDPGALEAIALRFRLTGGQIRNAAINAALTALDRGGPAVVLQDLERAIEGEYRKSGGAFPGGLTEAPAGVSGHISGFLEAVS